MTTTATPRIPRVPGAPEGHCNWCREPIDKAKHPRARSWHPDCVKEWEDEQPTLQRPRVWQRDRGVCQCCGLNLADLQSRLRGQRYWREILRYGRIPGKYARSSQRIGTDHAGGFYWGDVENGWPPRGHQPLVKWACDHVVPLWAGGANRTANLQVLCDGCHKDKTRREAGERAAIRRRERTGQTEIGGVA